MKLKTNPVSTVFKIVVIAAFISIGVFHITWGQTTVTLYPDQDCLLNSKTGYRDTNYPVSTAIRGYAWTEGGVLTIQRSLIKLDLSSIPVDATITSATLTLYGINHNPLTGSNACWVERVTQDWTETTATWNNQPATSTSDRISLSQSTSSTQNYAIDVSTFMQGWLEGSFSNYGIKIKLQTESTLS